MCRVPSRASKEAQSSDQFSSTWMSELHGKPFDSAPALYTFNVPRYFATNLRAREYAKQRDVQLSWAYARDVPCLPEDRELPEEKLEAKLFAWLQKHDQQTGHLPSIYPLAVGMPVRLTDSVDRSRQLYRGRKGVIHGWTLAPRCIPTEIQGEFVLDTLPLVVYIHFPEAKWRIGKLPMGVFPLKRRSRTWKVNKYTGIEARRTGFCMLPDFGSTAHMIQGATLEAAFVDLQHSSSKASMTSLIAAYVCLSRVKRLQNICVMQPFSPFLFALGNPAGPERLVRMLSGEITELQAIHEWTRLEDADAEMETTDVMARKHICACCYLKGNEEYMLDARDFGVRFAGDFYEKYVSQGRWTRCLECMREASIDPARRGGAQQALNAMPERPPSESSSQEASRCKRCIERDDVWNQNLKLNDHGCSACKKVFDASAWSWKVIKSHRERDRDLVCADCTERGYASGKYEEHQCEECLEIFGSLKFDRKRKYNTKRSQSCRLLCEDCVKSLRCSTCKTRYGLKYWSKQERKNHNSCLKTKLVCKACRAQGFTPWSVEAYTCHTCLCKFGPNKFATHALQNFINKRRAKVQCLQCDTAVEARVRMLRKQLQKSKRKCTCQCRIHQLKCPLTPVVFGEKRWPGSDGAISTDDRKFLDALNPPWWNRAWGR